MRTASKRIQLVGLSIAAAVGVAALGSATTTQRVAQPVRAFVAPQLVATAQTHPQQAFQVILQGTGTTGQGSVLAAVRRVVHGKGLGLGRRLDTIAGASATVTGRQLVALASAKGVAAITLDRPVHLTDTTGTSGTSGSTNLSTNQLWPEAARVEQGWSAAANGNLPTPPAIAFVDSGIVASRADFSSGARVIDRTTIVTSGTPNSGADGYGHGTFVAGIAAGSANNYAGAAPSAPIVSIDVLNDQGMALTSDVIAACDWILQHKTADNIRVANFSLNSTLPASVFWDPLDAAVEKLWFSGIVVVAAAGNYGTGSTPSGVVNAPANDPFVITVGADDIGDKPGTWDDTAAPFSAWGYTYDGFAKPDIAAPGRYMAGPVPVSSTLATTRSSSLVASNYIQLSGTSFAAPVISGAAAYLLALHPNWTPDKIKGALMLSARPEANATPGSVGVGLIDLNAASSVTGPPNPNLVLDTFLVANPSGGTIPVFDTFAWQAAARANPAWDQAAWGSAAWGSAAWGSAAWGSAAWGSAAWGSAAWGSAAWGSSALAQMLASAQAAWGSAAWGSAAYADSAPQR
ncbi:MAG: serine protease AprX [Gaiellaceae bacterium]|jgi:serine protease AprX|nr:serine protease AprX [Gaiellaceae bacterium]